MADGHQCQESLLRLLKARVPFISIRSVERKRVLDILRLLAEEIGIPVFFHTLSQGTRDLITSRTVNEDRSVVGGLDYAAQQIAQRENVTFAFTEISDLGEDNPISRQFYDTVMLAIDHGGSLVVITADPVWTPLQRLGMNVVLDPPNEDEMLQILKNNLDPYRPQISIAWGEEECREAASILANMTQVEAENVIATLLAKGAIQQEDLGELSEAKDRVFSDISGLERVKTPPKSTQVGGLAGLRQWLERQRPFLTADLRQRQLRPPRGVLLVGVPGCGKSLSAKFIASSWNMPLYRLDLASIHGQYLGQSEARLKDALTTADHVAPCVLWIDEIEKGLAGAVGSADGGTSLRMVGQFLFWLQESPARVFVVATANDVSRLPPELLRRGRFDELFFIDLPNEEERAEIIQLYVDRNLEYTLTDELLKELVHLSEGFSGADIEAAVREVAMEAIIRDDSQITPEIFQRSFTNVVPLSKTSPEQIEFIRAWGRERAVPASGMDIPGSDAARPSRRVLV